MEIEEIINCVKNQVEILANAELKDINERIFLKSTFIDSINMINLIVYLEEKYNITIDAFFENRESVSCVMDLSKYLKKKIDI